VVEWGSELGYYQQIFGTYFFLINLLGAISVGKGLQQSILCYL